MYFDPINYSWATPHWSIVSILVNIDVALRPLFGKRFLVILFVFFKNTCE